MVVAEKLVDSRKDFYSIDFYSNPILQKNCVSLELSLETTDGESRSPECRLCFQQQSHSECNVLFSSIPKE